MSELRDLLDAAVGSPAGRPDHDEIRRRGRRLIAGRVAGVLGVVVVVAGLAIGIASQLVDTDTTPPVVEQPTPPPTVDGEGVEACEPPRIRPTYLPWLEEGEEVPPPVEVHGGSPDEPDAVLLWVEDPQRYDPDDPDLDMTALRLATRHNPDHEPGTVGGEEVDVRGYSGEMIWVEPTTGSLGLSWREEPDPCGVIAVGLVVRGAAEWLGVGPDLPPEDHWEAIEDEMIRIADSLVDTVVSGSWVSEQQRRAWEAEHGETQWIVGYFYHPDHEADLGVLEGELSFADLEARWKLVSDEADLGREELLRRAIAELATQGPPDLDHPFEVANIGGVPVIDHGVELGAIEFDDGRLTLDLPGEPWARLAGGTTGEAMMLTQLVAVAAHYYPDADQLCILVDGEQGSVFSHGMTPPCPLDLP